MVISTLHHSNKKPIFIQDATTFLIERTPENGGDIVVKDYHELEALFLSLGLHPADLKSSIVLYLNKFFDAIRSSIQN